VSKVSVKIPDSGTVLVDWGEDREGNYIKSIEWAFSPDVECDLSLWQIKYVEDCVL